MNELIKIQVNENNEPLVSGRELHKFLEVKTRYNDWITDRIEKYGFIENKDFVLVTEKKVTNNPRNPYTNIQDHLMKTTMAKELAMIENNEKGKIIRKYFIEIEENYNRPEMILARANQIQQKIIEEYKEKILEYKPKAEMYEKIYESDSLYDMAETSKMLNFKNIGRNKIYEILRENKIINQNNEPYQEYVNRGYFKLVPTSKIDYYGNRIMKMMAYMKGVEYISKLLEKLGYMKKNTNFITLN